MVIFGLVGGDSPAVWRRLSGWWAVALWLVGDDFEVGWGAGSGAGPRYFSFVFSWPVVHSFSGPIYFAFCVASVLLFPSCYRVGVPLLFPFLSLFIHHLWFALLSLYFCSVPREKSKNNGEYTNPLQLLYFRIIFPLFSLFFRFFFAFFLVKSENNGEYTNPL